MIVSINQPAYLPWLGYFDRIQRSDLHIILDHVQFEKNSYVNRNRIRSREGWIWLTVPIQTKGGFGHLAIKDLVIAPDGRWPNKHWESLRQNYGRSPHWGAFAPRLARLYAQDWGRFLDLAMATVKMQLEALAIATPLVLSSELAVDGHKEALILNLVEAVGGTTYLSGPFGRDYLQPDSFAEAGIDLQFHDFQTPPYRQLSQGFESNLAALDALLSLGTDATARLLSRQ